MKCTDLLLSIILIAHITQLTLAVNKWEYKNLDYLGMSLKVVQLKDINTKAVKSLIELADKSAVTNQPRKLKGNYNTIFGPDDVFCISNKLFLWFSATPYKLGRVVRTGGGLLAGAWEIKFDGKSNIPRFKKMDEKSYYSPNALLPGSQPNSKLFGADAYGGYPQNKIVWSLENAVDVRVSSKTGKEIISLERGPFSADEGVFVEFKGVIGNSNTGEGIDSLTDTDPRPGVIGRTEYTLTYRVPTQRSDFIQEITFKAVKNNFGPISNAYVSLYLAGHTGKNMVYAANPELMPKTPAQELSNVSLNKYFKNSCVKKIFFYDVGFKQHIGSKLIAQTPDGKGRLACVGSPENKVSFVCAYPNNDYIPKETYEEYTLQISDNQSIKGSDKVIGLNYKLLSTPNKSITIKQGESLILIVRYKFIDAQVALPEGYTGKNLKNVDKPKVYSAKKKFKI